MTLCFNTVSEVDEAVRLAHDINDKRDFEHFIVDLEFPIEEGDVLPDNIETAKKNNTLRLKELARKYKSEYVRMKNIGVSQNWGNFWRYVKGDEGDVIISLEPDERIDIECGGWIKALADVIRGDQSYGVTSLLMHEHMTVLNETNTTEHRVNGVRVWDIKGNLNWAVIGVSGKLIKEIGGVPYLNIMKVYGGLESALVSHMDALKYRWCKLPDYTVVHTNNVPLLRQWKDDVIFNRDKFKGEQVQFEDWIKMKKNGSI